MSTKAQHRFSEEQMAFHRYPKDNPRVRKAIYEAYNHRCVYCGDLLQPKNMHVDHILASKAEKSTDPEFNKYLEELFQSGFSVDSLENYLPSCQSCNTKKNNKNYTVSNLRFFHQCAFNNVEKVVTTINRYSSDLYFPQERFHSDCWEELNFANQRDISYAISQYRLGPSDVVACPRLAQVEEIKKKLSIVNYVTIQGESGCGKSISVFQAAYDYFNTGWSVYRFVNKSTYDELSLPGPDDDERYLFIIDDSQNLPEYLIDKLCVQTQDNIKLILAKTIGDATALGEIIITNSDSVKEINRNYSRRIDELIPIVHMYDSSVGTGYLDLPLEYRLKDAAKARTPWQYNYILCGGWKTMRNNYLAIANHRRCGLLAATIAVLQILQLDHVVDFDWIKNYYANRNIQWSVEDLDFLIKHKIIASFDDLRIIHIESANVIVAQFLKIAPKEEKTILHNAIDELYKNKRYPILGLVWLYNGVSRHTWNNNFFAELVSENTISFLLDDLTEYSTSVRRRDVAYLIDVTFRLSQERSRAFIRKKVGEIADWISNADKDCAYAYSRVVNELINYDKELHTALVWEVNWKALLNSLILSPLESLYQWGKLINRLTYGFSENQSRELIGLMQEKLNL